MASYSTNEFRNGLKVMLEGEPCVVLEAEFVKPGKGQAFTRARFRNLISGRVWDRTLRSGETMESADVVELDMEYLYSDGTDWHFMRMDDTFEQVSASSDIVGDAERWLSEQDKCTVTLWEGNPISVVPPNFVELRVTDTEPNIRGDTVAGGSKPATLSTGTTIRVPLFIGVGEVVRVDTRTGEYVGRSKQS